jgi:hypothetical protein
MSSSARARFPAAFAILATSLLIGLLGCGENTNQTPAGQPDTRLILVPAGSKEKLLLSHAELIPGTTVLRADLHLDREGGFSSGGKGSYFETRNILFIDPSDKAAHWLLPDNDHVVVETTDITDDKNPQTKRIMAIVAFTKPTGDQQAVIPGRLLMVDTTGRNVS